MMRSVLAYPVSEHQRILLCCFEVVPGPTALSRRLTEYLKGLTSHYQVVVLSKKDADRSHIERFLGARLLRVPVGAGDFSSQLLAFERAVRRQLESEEYAAVHVFDPFAGAVLVEQRAEFGYPIVYEATHFPSVDLPSLEDNVDPKLVAKARRQELFCLVNASTVVVGSEHTKQYVVGLGVAEQLVEVLRSPVDCRAENREAPSLPNAVPMRVVHLGSLARYHGLATAIEAVALARSHVDIKLKLVGPQQPRELESLLTLVAKLQLQGQVDFHGPCSHEEIPRILAASDVGLLTLEDSERHRVVGGALPRVGEYLVAGRPIVAADLPVVAELVPPGARVLYQPGNAQSLADALISLARAPDLRERMGVQAKAGASTVDSRPLVGRVRRIYERLTGRPTLPDSEAYSADTQSEVRAHDGHSEVTELRAVTSDDSTGNHKVPTDPAISTARMPESAAEELEISNEEIVPIEGDEGETASDAEPAELADGEVESMAVAGVTPPRSALDPWFAQLVHGWGPPEETLFNRHTPPTTMPGRDG